MIKGLLQNDLLSFIAAIAVIGIIIYRQIRPRKISLRGLVVLPLILLLFLIESTPTFHPSQVKLLEIAISSAVSATLGLLACRQLEVYAGQSGKAMAKGSWIYFLWWLGAFVAKSILAILLGETNFKDVSPFEILVPIFLLVTTRNAYLYWKAAKMGFQLH